MMNSCFHQNPSNILLAALLMIMIIGASAQNEISDQCQASIIDTPEAIQNATNDVVSDVELSIKQECGPGIQCYVEIPSGFQELAQACSSMLGHSFLETTGLIYCFTKEDRSSNYQRIIFPFPHCVPNECTIDEFKFAVFEEIGPVIIGILEERRAGKFECIASIYTDRNRLEDRIFIVSTYAGDGTTTIINSTSPECAVEIAKLPPTAKAAKEAIDKAFSPEICSVQENGNTVCFLNYNGTSISNDYVEECDAAEFTSAFLDLSIYCAFPDQSSATLELVSSPLCYNPVCSIDEYLDSIQINSRLLAEALGLTDPGDDSYCRTEIQFLDSDGTILRAHADESFFGMEKFLSVDCDAQSFTFLVGNDIISIAGFDAIDVAVAAYQEECETSDDGSTVCMADVFGSDSYVALLQECVEFGNIPAQESVTLSCNVSDRSFAFELIGFPSCWSKICNTTDLAEGLESSSVLAFRGLAEDAMVLGPDDDCSLTFYDISFEYVAPAASPQPMPTSPPIMPPQSMPIAPPQDTPIAPHQDTPIAPPFSAAQVLRLPSLISIFFVAIIGLGVC